ncbi:MAG: ABC-type transport auxiliary lipoprotein family protein, partial [Burkholderiaceae bacterium]
PAPPLRYYPLRIEPPTGPGVAPGPTADGPPTGPPTSPAVWQLMLPVRMPEYLDRDTLWAAAGSGGLQPLDGQRWAEPLRSAVPRVLAHDLGVWHGAGQVWAGAAPAGMVVARQWRLELLEFAPGPGRVRLRARWSASDPQGASPTQAGEADIEAPIAGPRPDQLVDAHRLALWRLAERMARAATPSPPSPRS